MSTNPCYSSAAVASLPECAQSLECSWNDVPFDHFWVNFTETVLVHSVRSVHVCHLQPISLKFLLLQRGRGSRRGCDGTLVRCRQHVGACLPGLIRTFSRVLRLSHHFR